MISEDEGSGLVGSVTTMFDIVEILAKKGEANLTELANELDMPRSTLHGYLSTMVESEYIVKDGREYQLGLKFLEKGVMAQRYKEIYQKSGQFLDQLAEQTDEIVWLVVEEYGEAVCLRKVEGKLAIQPYKQIGKRLHMHNIAAGKAILSQLPRSEVDQIIDKHGLPQYTNQTITEREQLFAELDEIKDTGVAFNDEESLEGFRAVASPVCTDEGVEGSIVVSGPKNRFMGERFDEELPKTILGTTNALELELSS
jgi:DNA-binding IclR family transcriptional regulator